MRRLRVLVLSALCAVGSLGAQRNLAVDVRVTSVRMVADTTLVSLVVSNSPSSRERLFLFIVDGPAPVIRIDKPAPAANWVTSTRHKGVSVASWGILEAMVAPGSSSPTLTFAAIGLPTVVTYWATGHFRPPPYQTLDETRERPTPRAAMEAGGVPGKIVGVEPFPADLTPSNLLARLSGLTTQACDSLSWIRSASVCRGLQGAVDRAKVAAVQGDKVAARRELAAYVADLEAQHGTGTQDAGNAYWLLKVNAEFILGRL